MKIKHIVILILAMVLGTQAYSQTENFREPQRVESFLTELYPEAFNLTLMRDAILYYIDKELRKENYRMLMPNTILQNASQEFENAKTQLDACNEKSDVLYSQIKETDSEIDGQREHLSKLEADAASIENEKATSED